MAPCLLGKMNEKEGTVIYFDNAATTMQKPPEVAEAVLRAMTSFGGAGRGVHPASLAAGPCSMPGLKSRDCSALLRPRACPLP